MSKCWIGVSMVFVLAISDIAHHWNSKMLTGKCRYRRVCSIRETLLCYSRVEFICRLNSFNQQSFWNKEKYYNFVEESKRLDSGQSGDKVLDSWSQSTGQVESEYWILETEYWTLGVLSTGLWSRVIYTGIAPAPQGMLIGENWLLRLCLETFPYFPSSFSKLPNPLFNFNWYIIIGCGINYITPWS